MLRVAVGIGKSSLGSHTVSVVGRAEEMAGNSRVCQELTTVFARTLGAVCHPGVHAFFRNYRLQAGEASSGGPGQARTSLEAYGMAHGMD